MDIQAKEVIDKISEDLKVQPSLSIPRALSKEIQLSYNVNPERDIKAVNGTASDSTGVTIFTTHATKRTFMIGMNLSVAKDAISTSISSAIEGKFMSGPPNTNLFLIRYEPLTAGQFAENITFPIPIELEKGVLIRVTNTTAVGSIDTTAIIYFYEVDPL